MNYSGIIVILLLWNIVTFSMMGIDKLKAIRHKWRIGEATLLLSAFLMGAVGSVAGALVSHHKTRKLKFRIGLPAALIVNAAVVIFAAVKMGKVIL